jgi:5-methylcytosine-specific restriction protein A
MSTWIFQGNPKIFDVDGYLKSRKAISWQIRQEFYKEKLNLGDTVYIWRSDGYEKGSGGLVAKSIIIALPRVLDGSDAKEFWVDQSGSKAGLRVLLHLEELRLDDVVKRADIKAHPILRDLVIVKMRNRTNYSVSEEHSDSLREVWGCFYG